jgi:hypothetical protein
MKTKQILRYAQDDNSFWDDSGASDLIAALFADFYVQAFDFLVEGG